MLGNYLLMKGLLLNLFVLLLLGCAGKNNPKPVDLYERGGDGYTTPAEETRPPTPTSVQKRISNVSVNAYRLSNQLKQVNAQTTIARQKRAEVETRLRKVDFEIIQLTQKPTIPEEKVFEYAQRVERLEQELQQLAQILGTL